MLPAGGVGEGAVDQHDAWLVFALVVVWHDILLWFAYAAPGLPGPVAAIKPSAARAARRRLSMPRRESRLGSFMACAPLRVHRSNRATESYRKHRITWDKFGCELAEGERVGFHAWIEK